MAQEMEKPTSQTETKNYFRKLCAELPKNAWIRACIINLLTMHNREANSSLVSEWASQLEKFGVEDLIYGFTFAAYTDVQVLRVNSVIHPILDREFPADYGWLLNVLKIHAADLHPKPAVHGPYQRMPDPDKPGEFYAGREVIEPAVPAPALPARLARAAALFGQGSVEEGLARLEAHPSARGRYEMASEAMRTRQQLDRDFRQAWQMARMEELAK